MHICMYVYIFKFVVSAYKHFKGQVLGSEELNDLLTGLRSNRLLKYSYILTGTCVIVHVCVHVCGY